MRTILMAGAALVALGFTTSAFAGGSFWFVQKSLHDCYDTHDEQANCIHNNISDDGRSNDNNRQTWFQGNLAIIPSNDVEDYDQKNVAVQYVGKGDGNSQNATQGNVVFGDIGHNDDVDQDNLAINVVDEGDDNTQSATQVNVAAGDLDGDVDQSNTAVNVVHDGDGNTQSGTQINAVIAY